MLPARTSEMEHKTCLTIGRNWFYGAVVTMKESKKQFICSAMSSFFFPLSLCYPKCFEGSSLIVLNISDASICLRNEYVSKKKNAI